MAVHSEEKIPIKARKRPRWFASRQNMEFEIDLVRVELNLVSRNFLSDPEDSMSSGTDKEPRSQDKNKRLVLEECQKLLELTEKAFCCWFPREVIVWQNLGLIRQNLLLIVHPNELSAKWESIRSRLSKLSSDDQANSSKLSYWQSNKFATWVDGKLKDRTHAEDDELRIKLKEARKCLDDRLVAQLWTGISLRRYGVFFITSSFLLSASLIGLISYEFFCGCRIPWCGITTLTLIGVFISGTLGALLSTLISRSQNDQSSTPPFANLLFVRPIIGGIAGLFLFFLAAGGYLDVKPPVLYAVAIAFGFSERALYNALARLTGNVDKNISRMLD